VLSALAAEHVRNAGNCGPLEGATSVGRYGSEGGGPYMTLWIDVQSGRIARAAYKSNGCPAAMACGSMTCEIVRGRTVEEALRLERDDLIVILGGLPEGKGECAAHAIFALQDALKHRGEN
jgi:nitrogen fixation NifU-like protein